MKVLETVPFTAVFDRFRHEHAADRDHVRNSNAEGEELLRLADAVPGEWVRVTLDRQDVLGVMLPWHTGEGGDFELVPPAGLTVADAVERLRAEDERYRLANPVCADRLAWLVDAPASPLFLCTRAVETVDYAGLAVREGVIHLDGLHRMIAWESSGRLAAGAPVEAYLAGVPAGYASAPADVGHRTRHDGHRLHVDRDR